MPKAFFSGTPFVLFREPGTVAMPLASGLRARSGEAAWGEDTPSGHAASYRAAVNLLIDVFESLPRPADMKVREAPSPPPVIFGIDRVDNGAGSRFSSGSYGYGGGSSGYYTRSYDSNFNFSEPYWVYTYHPISPSSSYGSSSSSYSSGNDSTDILQTPLNERPGINVAEWAVQKDGDKARVKALIINNEAACATQLELSYGPWKYKVPGTFAPLSMKIVELEAPSAISGAKLKRTWKEYPCKPPFPPAGGVSGEKRVIVSAAGFAPRFPKPNASSIGTHARNPPAW
jgi:hypothetical protein